MNLCGKADTFSFGTLSKLYKNMKNPDKKAIAQTFGVDEILAMNVGDDAYGRFKNIIYFASDRSGMHYAFDKQDGGICIIGIDEDSFDYSEAYKVADTFEEFIQYNYDIADDDI